MDWDDAVDLLWPALRGLGWLLYQLGIGVWRYLWLRWIWGDPFEHPLASQSRPAVLWRAVRVGAVLAGCSLVTCGVVAVLSRR